MASRLRRGWHGIRTHECAGDHAAATRRVSARSSDGRSDTVAESRVGMRRCRHGQRTGCGQLREIQDRKGGKRHRAVLGTGAAAIALVAAAVAPGLIGRQRRRFVLCIAGAHGLVMATARGHRPGVGALDRMCARRRVAPHGGMHYRHRSIEDQREAEQDAKQHGERRHPGRITPFAPGSVISG